MDEMKDSLSVNKEEERIARVSGNIEYLCEELATNKNLDCNDWFEQFSDFSETIDRLAYSDISRYIFGLEPKGLGILEKNLVLIDRKTRDLKPNSAEDRNRLYDYSIRFYDHCMLALAQKEIVLNTEKKAASSITGQFIGLISIFTALSFVLSGGITALGSIMDAVRTQNLYYTLFVGLIWLLCMGNLFVLFMHFVMKISGKDGIKAWLYILVIAGETLLCGLIGFALLRSHIIIHI